MVAVPEKKKFAKDPRKYQFPYQLDYEGVPYYTDANMDDPWHVAMRNHFNAQCEDLDNDGMCDTPVKIMDIYAWTAPDGKNDLYGEPGLSGEDAVKIGEIQLKTPLYYSQAGDDRLFFQHIRMKKDRRVWPDEWKGDWLQDFVGVRDDPVFDGIPEGMRPRDRDWPWPHEDDEAKDKYMELEETHGCPFSWLFNLSA